MTAYRDDIEALEAEAEELRTKLAAVEEEIAHVERVRDAKRASLPKGPPIWASCLLLLLVPIALVLVLAVRFTFLRG